MIAGGPRRRISGLREASDGLGKLIAIRKSSNLHPHAAEKPS